MINIAYIANPNSIHDCKWINKLVEKYNVIVISSDYNVAESYLNDNIKVFNILPSTFPFRNIIKRKKISKQIKYLIEENKISIVHTMYAFPNSFWVNIIGFKKHIITTRGSDILVDYKKLFNSTTIKEKIINTYFLKQFNETFNNAVFITSTSIKQKEIIKTFVDDENKLRVIRTGVDASLMEGCKISNEKKNNNKIVLFSPRSMKPIYNIDIIIDAFCLFNKKNNSILYIINDLPNSDYSKKILNKINELNIEDKCVILPKLNFNKMIHHFSLSDIVISIPTTDGTPNSVLEAMFMEKPIIIGPYKLDSDIFGALFQLEKLNSNMLCDKIEEIVGLETARLNELLEGNKQKVSLFADIEKSVIELNELYKQVISGT